MAKFSIGVYEELGATIEVEAENQEKAEALAAEIVNDNGIVGLEDGEYNMRYQHRACGIC